MSKIKKIIDYNKLHGPIQTVSWLGNNVKYRISKLVTKPIEFELGDLTEEDKNYMVPKTKGNVFIFATVAFYDVGGGQRSAQLAKVYNKLGYNVYYIFAFDSSETKKVKIEIPVCMHKYIDNISVDTIEQKVTDNDIVIFEAPCTKFRDYLTMFQEKKVNIVYENIDNWESSLGNDVFDADTLKEMLESATMLTATAKQLVEQLEIYLDRYGIKNKKVVYLPNAVNDEMFNASGNYEKPSDMFIGEKTLVYYGSLWLSCFDWDLVYGIAQNNPNIQINLIGDYKEADIRKVDNVHFLGMKKQSELPAYLYYSDFAILPFKVDNIASYVSPLKIFEYIAMNKKILAEPLPDIIGYPNLYTGTTIKEWQKIIDSKKPVDTKASQEFISENNWYSRCITILETLNRKEAKKCATKYYDNISVVVLNYNNDKVIFKCIDTLLQFNERYNYEIIVVDNQSTDGSYEKLVKTYKKEKQVKIVRNEKNGCSSGRNLGVANASNKYILFLDSDQWVLQKYWLDNYLDMFSEIDNVGAIAWNAGWFNEYGLSYRFVDNYDYRSMPANTKARCDIGYLATCGFLIEKKLFESIEGFDEAYDPTCYEDTDLALKVRNSGKEIYYSSLLGVGHLPHQTTKAGSSEHDKLILEKGNYFVSKWKEINPDLLKYKK